MDFEDQVIHRTKLGDYVKDKVLSLNHFMDNYCKNQEYTIPSLMALSNALRYLQRYEFNGNHGEWVHTVKPDLGPGISERVSEAVRTTGENVGACQAAMAELRSSLGSLLEVGYRILAIPTVPGPPPKLCTEASTSETFRARAFSLLAIAGMSGFCQVSIPLGMYNGLPVAVSLIARHGSDMFLLNLVKTLCSTLKEQAEIAEQL
ncbi:Amidase 1 [Asimina triloba]